MQTRKAFTLRLILAIGLLSSFKTATPPIAQAQTDGGSGNGFGFCLPQTCHYVWDAEGNADIFCSDPNFPTCLWTKPATQVCPPNSSFQSFQCGPGGVYACSYQCLADGSGYRPSCQYIATPDLGGVIHWCSYNASDGCAPGEGREVRAFLYCKLGGTGDLQDVTYGACGTCKRTIGPTPVPRPTSPPNACPRPSCVSNGCSWSCSWHGEGLASVDVPVPDVVRNPFPRGMVGVPNQMAITSGCDGPSANGGVENSLAQDPKLTCDSTKIYGYRVNLSWSCAVPGDLGATWTMNDRAWNLGHTTDAGEIIENMHGGNAIQHTYETSSYGLPASGPGPDLVTRQSAYQVVLQTNWQLNANFERKVEDTVTGCFDDNGKDVTPCYSANECNWSTPKPDCSHIKKREKTELVWKPAEAFVYSPIPILGARVSQDTASPGGCNAPVPLAILQAQSVVQP